MFSREKEKENARLIVQKENPQWQPRGFKTHLKVEDEEGGHKEVAIPGAWQKSNNFCPAVWQDFVKRNICENDIDGEWYGYASNLLHINTEPSKQQGIRLRQIKIKIFEKSPY